MKLWTYLIICGDPQTGERGSLAILVSCEIYLFLEECFRRNADWESIFILNPVFIRYIKICIWSNTDLRSFFQPVTNLTYGLRRNEISKIWERGKEDDLHLVLEKCNIHSIYHSPFHQTVWLSVRFFIL